MTEHYFSERPTSKLKRGLVRCNLRGQNFEFLTTSGVFSHKRIDTGTRLLIESMILPERGAMLDLGCGYGPVGVVASKLKPRLRVWMTDINERAAALAEENSRRNGVEHITVRQGHLYDPVEGFFFDVIVSNPPISAGMSRVVKPLVMGAGDHLVRGGSLQLVVQSNKGGRTLLAMMESYLGVVEVVARKSGYRVLRSEKSLE